MMIDELIAELENVDRSLSKNNGAKVKLRNLKRRILSEGIRNGAPEVSDPSG